MTKKERQEATRRIKTWAVAHAKDVDSGGPGLAPTELRGLPEDLVNKVSLRVWNKHARRNIIKAIQTKENQ